MPRVAVIRGDALNPYEMQAYSQVTAADLLAIGRLRPRYDIRGIDLPRVLLPALQQMPLSRRLAQSSLWDSLRLPHPDNLLGLRWASRGRNILHAAEIALPLTGQCLDIAASTGARTILTCWENIPFRGDEDAFTRALKRRAVSAVDRYVATSASARSALIEEGVDEERIEVIPPGIDCRRFTPAGARSGLRRRLNLPEEALLVLYVGRVIGEKGVVELVRALSTVEGSRLHLAIIGEGNQKERVRHAAIALSLADRVHISSHVAYGDLPSLLRSADLIAVPSLSTPYWQEQFGMILAESMACGLPILTTSSGSIPEVVGNAALIVKDYDIRQLADGLRTLATDHSLRAQYSALGRQRALEEFDAAVVARRLDTLYQHVLANAPRSHDK